MSVTEWELNPACRCKRCTGEGLGWIAHRTAKQTGTVLARIKRMERDRKQYLDKTTHGWVPVDFH